MLKYCYNIHMIYYTESEKANYAHIHAYAFYDLFLSQIKTQNLSEDDFQIDVNIEGNVVEWSIETSESKIQELFRTLTSHTKFTNHQISDAITKICHKNNFKAHLKNLDRLKSELHHIKFQTQKPEITDDSLTSDDIDFVKLIPNPRSHYES